MQRKFWTPIKVGLLTIAAVVALVFGVLKVTKGGLNSGNSYEVFAIFDDASGLRSKTKVQIAGIEVGQIQSVALVGNKAKVVLRIKNEITLYSDARIAKRSEGFIGDMMLDISPGHTPPRIQDGGQIKDVVSAGSMEQVFATLGKVTKDIQSVTGSIKEVLGGEKGAGSIKKIVEDMTTLTESVNKTILENSEKLNDILTNFQALSRSARDLTTGESGTVQAILANVEQVTGQIHQVASSVQDVLDSVKQMLGTNRKGFSEGVAGLRQSLDTLNASLTQVEDVTRKVAQGKGTVGKLLTDDTLARKLEKTVSDASDFVNRLTGLKTEVRMRAEYYLNHGSGREVFNVRLKPAEDKWYEVGIVSPLPVWMPDQVTTYDAAGKPTQTTIAKRSDQLTFNALMAHRWRFRGFSLTGKFGLIETTGGVAGDVGLFDGHLDLSLEAFDFGNRYKKWPRVRAFATASFLGHLFVTGGVDDVLNAHTLLPPTLASDPIFDKNPRDFFVGAGFYFTDQDLSSILSVVGVPKP